MEAHSQVQNGCVVAAAGVALGWALHNAVQLRRSLPKAEEETAETPEEQRARYASLLWLKLATALVLLAAPLGILVLFSLDFHALGVLRLRFYAALSFCCGVAATLLCGHLAVGAGTLLARPQLQAAGSRAERAVCFASEGLHLLAIFGLAVCFGRVTQALDDSVWRESLLAYALGCALVAVFFRLSAGSLKSAAENAGPLGPSAAMVERLAGPVLQRAGIWASVMAVGMLDKGAAQPQAEMLWLLLSGWAVGLLCLCAVDLLAALRGDACSQSLPVEAAGLMLVALGGAYLLGWSFPSVAAGLCLSIATDLLPRLEPLQGLDRAFPRIFSVMEVGAVLAAAGGWALGRWGQGGLALAVLGFMAPSPLRPSSRALAPPAPQQCSEGKSLLLWDLAPFLCFLAALGLRGGAGPLAGQVVAAAVVGAMLPQLFALFLAHSIKLGGRKLRRKAHDHHHSHLRLLELGAAIAVKQSLLPGLLMTAVSAATSLALFPALGLLVGLGLAAVLGLDGLAAAPSAFSSTLAASLVLSARYLALSAIMAGMAPPLPLAAPAPLPP